GFQALDEPGKCGAVHAQQQLHDLPHLRTRRGIDRLLRQMQQAVQPLQAVLKIVCSHASSRRAEGESPPRTLPYPCTPNIGTWRTSRTLPPPRYMCTPHGRQGSKLRTARMMSIPLKLSRPFSSKIGIPDTASS